MPVQTWVARFVVAHGQVTEEGGRLRAFQRRRLDEPDADLYLLAEPSGPNAEDLGAQTLQAIGRLFLGESLKPEEASAIRKHPSLTGSLLAALHLTHQTLLDWNRRSIGREQVGIGVSGALLRGATAFLVQAGPSLVFLYRNGALERLAPTAAAATPLGEDGIEPELRLIELAPGDLLVAASPAIESVLDRETLEGMLARGSEEALPDLYLMTRDLESFALFAISCFEPPEPEPPEAVAAAPAPAAAGAAKPDAPRLVSDAAPALSFAAAAGAVIEAPGGATALALAAPKPLDISRSVVRLRADQINSRNEYARTTGPTRLRLDIPAARLLGIAGAVALVVFLAFFAVPKLVRENRTEQTATLVQQAQTAYGAALNEADPAVKRRLLDETSRLSGEALRNDPRNLSATDVRAQAQAGLKALDAVFDVSPLATITTLGRQVTGDVSIDRVIVAGGFAYLLDTRGRRVLAESVNGGPPAPVFEEGQTYGGVPARRPQLMAWDGSDRGGRLLVLDADRKLFEVKPGALALPLGLRKTTTWASVAAIAAYDGNLYVLDPKGGVVHRYLPSANGFDSEPAPALAGQVTLTGAKDLAVNADIYVLIDDGRVRRFRNGLETDFSLGGIDRALVSPASLTVIASSGEVLVADTGHKRVVVASAVDGRFLRQFVSNSFTTDLRAVTVDATGNQLYAIVGDALVTGAMKR